MNNKLKGTAFERKMSEWFAGRGYWVHFLAPDKTGAQPFDLIIVKDGHVVAADCKTCKDPIFRMRRAESNQVLAFERWIRCGNGEPYFFVEHEGSVYSVGFSELVESGKIDLRERSPMCILE